MNDMAYEAQRVAQGAALLDRVEPGWYDRIDLGALEMASGCACICGQLGGQGGRFYSGYSHGLFGHEFAPYESGVAVRVAHGFLNDSAVSVLTEEGVQQLHYVEDADIDAEYARLDTLWTEAILRRRARDRYVEDGYTASIVDETLVVDGVPALALAGGAVA